MSKNKNKNKNKSKKNNDKNRNIQLLNNVSVTAYTEEVFYTSYPGTGEEEYEEVLHRPLNVVLQSIENQMNHLKINSMRKVVLDNEYIEWLKYKKKENNSDNRNLYATSLSDEEVERLWIKNRFNESFIAGYLIVSFSDMENGMREEAEINIVDESRLVEIRNLLAKEINVLAKDIAISSKLYRPDFFIENIEQDYIDYLIGEDILKTNIISLKNSPKSNIYSTNHYINVCFKVMPLVIKTNVPCFYNREDILNEVDLGNICGDIGDITTKKINTELKKGLGLSNLKTLDIDIYPAFIDIDDMEDAVTELNEGMAQAVEDINKEIRNKKKNRFKLLH